MFELSKYAVLEHCKIHLLAVACSALILLLSSSMQNIQISYAYHVITIIYELGSLF